MIRLSYPSTQLGERQATFGGDLIRMGTGDACEVRIRSPRVALAEHHADLLREHGAYVVMSRSAANLLRLNGRPVKRARIQAGDRIQLGGAGGPEIQILQIGVAERPPEFEDDEPPEPTLIAAMDVAPARPRTKGPAALALSAAPEEVTRPAVVLAPLQNTPSRVIRNLGTKLKELGRPHEEVMDWLGKAARQISDAREAPGISSGHTLVIMARALVGLRQTAEGRTDRWKQRLGWVLVLGVLGVAALGGVIWWQQQQIQALVAEKAVLDTQIQSVFNEMVTETDETRLAELEARLEVLMGRASEKILQVSRSNAKKAEELEKPVDPLEEDIRKILKSFGAETYAIPPIFKQTLQTKIDAIVSNSGTANTYARKQRYWPAIQKALRAKQLPEELGYIAYTESRFDPTVKNAKSGASGMWQLMTETARTCGITVDARRDDRFDAGRSSTAAACYLSKLLIEFGEESFMLAMASYNRGENGVRRSLHKLAKEPGGYRKRDFWHLYRLKLLPEETREYVPTVIAAAIVFGNPEKYGLPLSPRR